MYGPLLIAFTESSNVCHLRGDIFFIYRCYGSIDLLGCISKFHDASCRLSYVDRSWDLFVFFMIHMRVFYLLFRSLFYFLSFTGGLYMFGVGVEGGWLGGRGIPEWGCFEERLIFTIGHAAQAIPGISLRVRRGLAACMYSR